MAFSTREGLFYSSANQLCGIDFVRSEHSNAPFVKQMTAQNTQQSRDGRDALETEHGNNNNYLNFSETENLGGTAA